MQSLFKAQPIRRAPGVSERAVAMGLGGRFTDELLSGLPAVLMPTLRAQFGLSYTQISVLDLALRLVAAAIEPGAALLIDVWQRRWLMAWGAAGVGLSTMLLGLAPNFLFLLAAFAVYGLASGPLAHTADVVLVEAHPKAPDRIFARATLLDNIGALLSPLSVTVTVWAGLSWRWLLLALGFCALIYGVLLLKTTFPAPTNGAHQQHLTLLASLRQNVRAAAVSWPARRWLAFLFALEILEAPQTFTTVWLNEQAGMGQGLVGVYVVLDIVVGLLSLLYLERWLARSSARRILGTANAALLILTPLWLLVPGVWSRFVLAVPIAFFYVIYWPIGRVQLLRSVPGRAGAVTALHSLFGLVPLRLLFGLLAERASLTVTMLSVSLAALLLLSLITWRLPPAAWSAVEAADV